MATQRELIFAGIGFLTGGTIVLAALLPPYMKMDRAAKASSATAATSGSMYSARSYVDTRAAHNTVRWALGGGDFDGGGSGGGRRRFVEGGGKMGGVGGVAGIGGGVSIDGEWVGGIVERGHYGNMDVNVDVLPQVSSGAVGRSVVAGDPLVALLVVGLLGLLLWRRY